MRTGLYLAALLALGASLIWGCGSGTGPAAVGPSPLPSPLLDPQSPEMLVTPPDSFRVLFETTQGDFVVAVRSAQAPLGARRFYNLVRHGFFDGSHFFRVLQGFVVQFGIHRDPEVSRVWSEATIADDPVVGSNVRGTLSFGAAGPNTRATQLFINLGDNSRLDVLGFSPVAQITGGMDVVDRLYGGYGEGAPMGNGPDQARIQSEGSTYLENNFPRLDRIVRARILRIDP
jgi:peptidyl-prolyl cis-trans isomerase A (cyclophilin A)